MARGRGWIVALAGAGVIVLGLGAAARATFTVPGDVEPVPVTCAPDAPSLPRGRALKVLVWNVQYAASRKHHFFYDGGRAVRVPEDDVRATLDRIGEVLRREDADVVLLQEVDRDSARTHRIDQHVELLARAPYPCSASTWYHRVPYVPTPSWEHLGRVDMHLSVFSRYRLDDARRVALPLLDEPWWRQVFNLRRAVLDVRVPLEGGGALRLLDTHLSAFSRGDGTLDRQMEVLDQLASTSESAREPWLLAGDLNALPPGDDASRLGDDADQYPETTSPIERLFRRYDPLIPLVAHRDAPERWRTYLPFGATAPDRAIDHVFVGRAVDAGEARVLPETDVSDHLPLVFTVTVP